MLVRTVGRARRTLRVPIAFVILALVSHVIVLAAGYVRNRPGPGASRRDLMQVSLDRQLADWRETQTQTGRPCPPFPQFDPPYDLVDLWDQEVRVLCEASPPHRLFVISAGPDRQFGTDDDLEGR
jgi:hypothetical protein